MPQRATAAELPTRRREGAGRSKVYEIDLSDLKDIVGETEEVDGNVEPVGLIYTPEEMASETGDVPQLSTFTNQVRTWVDEYNKSLKAGATKYRAKTKNYPIRDKDGKQVRGTVKNGKIVPTDDESETELYRSWVAIVPLTEKDLRRREAHRESRRKNKASGNSEASDTSNEATDEQPAKASK